MNLELLQSLLTIAIQRIPTSTGANAWLCTEQLVDADEEQHVWRLTERGRVFLEYLVTIPLPEPVRAWRMPGAPSPSAPAVAPRATGPLWDPMLFTGVVNIASDLKVQPGNADSADDDGIPPPRPPAPKPIPGIVLAEDPQARRNQARQLLDRGFGVNEVAETLELPVMEVEQMFLAG